jgi:predicted transcriptional regulator
MAKKYSILSKLLRYLSLKTRNLQTTIPISKNASNNERAKETGRNGRAMRI